MIKTFIGIVVIAIVIFVAKCVWNFVGSDDEFDDFDDSGDPDGDDFDEF